MKKLWAIFMLLVLIFTLAACNQNSQHHEMITKAIDLVKSNWTAYYIEDPAFGDGYFEIKNTRVITIKENDIELFADLAYIIEFDIYTDLYGSAPYYADAGLDDCVVVYKNGAMDVVRNVIQTYRNTTYQSDFSAFIETIDDYHEQYNCITDLR